MSDADSDADEDEMVQANFDVRKSVKDTAQENTEHGGWSEGLRQAAREMAYGEPIADAEEKCDLKRVQWERTEAGIDTVLSDLADDASAGGAVSLEAVQERFDEFRRKQDETIAQANAERLQQAQSKVADRDADPNTLSVGAEMTAVEAAEEMLDDTGRVPDTYIREGPENVGVQNFAEKCGMEPAEFWETAQKQLSDEAFGLTDGGGLP